MKSKSILQRKPELIVVALLAMFLLSGTAAADAQMISHHAIVEYLTAEARFVFGSVVTIMTIVGATIIAFGSPEKKAKGIIIVTACLIAVAAYYVVPYLIHDMETIATTGNNTTST